MHLAEPFSTASSDARRPRDNELDLFGITHPGRVRRENQDHFLLCTIHPQVVVHGTSLPHADRLPLRGQRLATIMLVADGVGGATAGADASRIATESITRYASSTLRCYHIAGRSNDDEFLEALRAAASEAHEAVRADALARHQGETTATTLTLGIVVWPWLWTDPIGHVKQWLTAPPDVVKKAAAGNTIHRCQRCITIYEGPPQEFLHPKAKKK